MEQYSKLVHANVLAIITLEYINLGMLKLSYMFFGRNAAFIKHKIIQNTLMTGVSFL